MPNHSKYSNKIYSAYLHVDLNIFKILILNSRWKADAFSKLKWIEECEKSEVHVVVRPTFFPTIGESNCAKRINFPCVYLSRSCSTWLPRGQRSIDITQSVQSLSNDRVGGRRTRESRCTTLDMEVSVFIRHKESGRLRTRRANSSQRYIAARINEGEC